MLVTGLQGTGKSTIANAAGKRLGATTLAHDWAMSGLRPFPQIQDALDSIELGHRRVGWSILGSLARPQLRRGAAVVLDGVARAPEVNDCRVLAAEEGARLVVVLTECTDIDVHRSRVEGRQRCIPNWYELNWEHVERAISTWEPIGDPDLVLDAASSFEHNTAVLYDFFDHLQQE